MGEGQRGVTRILTVPEHIKDYHPLLPTGNLHVSLPLIDPVDGSVDRVNGVWMNARGLVEFAGDRSAGRPLMAPWLTVDGSRVPLRDRLIWERLEHWVPRFAVGSTENSTYQEGEPRSGVAELNPREGGIEADAESRRLSGVDLVGTIFAPVGHRGFVYLLELTNRGPDPVDVEAGLEGWWSECLQTVYTSRHIHGHRHVVYNTWSQGPIFELRPSVTQAALAASTDGGFDRCGWRADQGQTGQHGAAEARQDLSRDELCLSGTDSVEWVLGKLATLAPGETLTVPVYWAMNQETDGARTTAIDLARRGWRRLLNDTLDWLRARHHEVPSEVQGSQRLTHLLNLNKLFNYFYSQGYTIDTEELVLVTSRSPQYYVSAAFWARDALLWSFPAMVITDPDHARRALYAAFSTYMRNPGLHSLYIDGSLLYPGFELDELIAYIIALDTYVRHTEDETVLDEQWVREGVDRVVKVLRHKRHPNVALYETFLYPSDDPIDQPYVTYDNVLTWRALSIVAELYEHWGCTGESQWARAEAQQVRRAITKRCVVDGPAGRMFAWCVDPDSGEYTLYDEPPGSLRMLAYYGFCALEDPVYVNTVNWIFSKHNPHYYPEARFNEVGCPHTDEPFVMGLFNSLLNGREESALEILREVELDAGLACEGFDRETGVVRTGAAFATCGGFLAYAMWRALVAEPKGDGAVG